jgi:hypothetical protein
MSKCYAMTGVKTKYTAKEIDTLYKTSDEKLKMNDAQFDTTPSNSTMEIYNQLKVTFPNN